jgi:hypothetical protein
MRWFLALVIVLSGCGGKSTDDRPKPLDEEAVRACAVFEDLMADFDSLGEAEIRDQTLEMWEDAQVSQTTGIRLSAREFVSAVFENLTSRMPSTVKEMRVACAGRASPHRTIESND